MGKKVGGGMKCIVCGKKMLLTKEYTEQPLWVCLDCNIVRSAIGFFGPSIDPLGFNDEKRRLTDRRYSRKHVPKRSENDKST